MKTLIFGAGFLGKRLAASFPGAVLSPIDICRPALVEATLREAKPDVVINAAGKTGRPNVDWCETHPTETWSSNVLGPMVLAKACHFQDIYLLHLGSGCIFYGPSPSPGGWREDDPANPSAVYSRSKYAADLFLSLLPNVGIARLRMPIDHVPGPRNLITKLAAYSKVIDVENSVTVVDDLVLAVAKLLEQRATGIFHLTNPGVMRHRDLLNQYKALVDPEHRVEYLAEGDLLQKGLVARSRSNCILRSDRLAALGISMRPVGEAVTDCLRRYKAAIAP